MSKAVLSGSELAKSQDIISIFSHYLTLIHCPDENNYFDNLYAAVPGDGLHQL